MHDTFINPKRHFPKSQYKAKELIILQSTFNKNNKSSYSKAIYFLPHFYLKGYMFDKQNITIIIVGYCVIVNKKSTCESMHAFIEISAKRCL